MGDSGSDLVFSRAGWVAFWLVQGGRDRDTGELEGVSLGAGRLGEHRHGGRGAGEPDLAGGQGGQVIQQAAEAAVGLPGQVVLAGRLGLGSGAAEGGGDRVSGASGFSSVKVSGAQILAQLPGQVAGQYADQYVGPDVFKCDSIRWPRMP